MQVDRFTRGVLTVIAALLGIIAMNGSRGGGTRSYAAPPEQPAAGTPGVAHYQVSSYRDGEGNLHLLVVDNWKDTLFDHTCTGGEMKPEGVPVHSLTLGQPAEQ